MPFVATLAMRDLRAKSQRSYPRLRRLIPILFCFVLILLVSFFGMVTHSPTTLGLKLYKTVLPFCLLLALFVSPLTGGKMAATEMEEGSLDMLLLTGNSLTTVITARFLSALLQLMFVVGGLIPLLFLCVGLGGVSFLQLNQGILLTFSLAASGCALGLLTSTLVGKRFPVPALSVIIGWTFILPGVVRLLPGGAYRDWIQSAFPFSSSSMIVRGVEGAQAWTSIGGHLLLALLFLAATLLTILWRQRYPVHLRRRASVTKRRAVPLVPNDANPIRWRDVHYRYRGSSFQLWFSIVLAVVAILYSLFSCQARGVLTITKFLEVTAGFIATVTPMLLIPLYLWRNLDTFTLEGPGIKEMLVLSELEGRTVVRGKHAAVFRGMRSLFIFWGVGLILWAILASHYNHGWGPVAFLSIYCLVLVPPTYFAGRIAAYCSLTHPGDHVRNTMMTGLAWFGSLFVMMFSNVIICAIGFMGSIVLLIVLGILTDKKSSSLLDQPTGRRLERRPQVPQLPVQ